MNGFISLFLLLLLCEGCGTPGVSYGGLQTPMTAPGGMMGSDYGMPMPGVAPMAMSPGYGSYSPYYAAPLPPEALPPMRLPTGGRSSPFGGSMYAGSDFDPMTADRTIANEQRWEAARHPSVVLPSQPADATPPSYPPAAPLTPRATAPTPTTPARPRSASTHPRARPPSPSASSRCPQGCATTAQVGGVVDQVENLTRRIRRVEQQNGGQR